MKPERPPFESPGERVHAARELRAAGDLEPGALTSPLMSGLTAPRQTRRQFLRGAGAVGAGLSASALLAACGIKGTASESADSTDWKVWWSHQKKAGVLNFANWPLYIDTSKGGKHPSLEEFSKQYDTTVNYTEPINNNAPFYAQISPELAQGQGTGYDLIVMTDDDWTVNELVRLNHWITPLDHSRMPNFFKYASRAVRNPPVDPGNRYTAAWQSGFTGIAYDTTKIDREINSIMDLFDPAFKGHVGMMSDNTELGSAGLLAIGVNPQKSTPADWEKAARLLQKQQNDGLVAQYYDQSYIHALETGDVWITQAWSGDIFQANQSGYPHLKWVSPKEGLMFWTDTMMIPLHAQHPVDAMDWINFYYQPKIAAMVEDWVNYICPVPDAKQILVRQDPTVGRSDLVFPNGREESLIRYYYTPNTFAEYNHWNNVFNPIINS